MSAPANILDIANAYREALIALETEATSAILDAYMTIRRDLEADVQALTIRIQHRINHGENVPVSWLHRQTRYQQLLTQAEAEVSRLVAALNPQLTQLQADAALLGDEAARMLLGQAGVQVTARLPNAALVEFVGRLSDGSPLSDLLNELGPDVRQRIEKRLTDVVARGINPRRFAREVSDALGGNMARAMNIMRTESISSFRNSSLSQYREHSDVLRGWKWSARLDGRTCASCWAQHGKVFPLSTPFASHPSCRCVPSPWSDTATEFPSGPAAFADAPASLQSEVLGPAKYRAYRDGTINLDDLIQSGTDRRWGPFTRERSLAGAIGSRADKYYQEAAG